MKDSDMNRTPLIQNRDGKPFVFYNTDLNRIEFVHGHTRSVIRLSKDAKVSVMPPLGEPGFLIREDKEAHEKNGIFKGKAVYAEQTADYGEPIRDSRGHIFCSIKEYGPDDDIIITVRRDKRHYFIYFPYSPWQSGEERIA